MQFRRLRIIICENENLSSPGIILETITVEKVTEQENGKIRERWKSIVESVYNSTIQTPSLKNIYDYMHARKICIQVRIE